MIELNRRFGEDLWTPVHDWLFDLADQPFGEAQVAAGYGLALLAGYALGEVEATYLHPWSAGNLRNRLMAVSTLWAMAEDERLAPAALRITVSYVRNQGQERAITAALALGGPLGQRHPSEAMRWLWVLSQRGERVGRVARTAISQMFAAESEADIEKSRVVRYLLLEKLRPVLQPDAPAQRDNAVRQRRGALAVANSVLGATQALSDVPAMATVLRRRRPISALSGNCGPRPSTVRRTAAKRYGHFTARWRHSPMTVTPSISQAAWATPSCPV